MLSDALPDTGKPVVEIFCICRNAEVVEGALNIVGASTRLRTAAQSVIVPQVTVVLSVRFPLAAEGLHDFRVSAMDLHGEQVGPPVSGAVKVAASGNDVYAWMQVSVILPNRRFNTPGDFRFDLAIDGEPLASCLLCVVRG